MAGVEGEVAPVEQLFPALDGYFVEPGEHGDTSGPQIKKRRVHDLTVGLGGLPTTAAIGEAVGWAYINGNQLVMVGDGGDVVVESMVWDEDRENAWAYGICWHEGELGLRAERLFDGGVVEAWYSPEGTILEVSIEAMIGEEDCFGELELHLVCQGDQLNVNQVFHDSHTDDVEKLNRMLGAQVDVLGTPGKISPIVAIKWKQGEDLVVLIYPPKNFTKTYAEITLPKGIEIGVIGAGLKEISQDPVVGLEWVRELAGSYGPWIYGLGQNG